MKRPTSLTLLLSLMALTASAYPPAPDYRIYGSVRDSHGDPLATSQGAVVLSGFLHSAYGIAAVGRTAVTGVAIKNGGSGFSSAPTVTFSGGLGSGATGTAILTNGVVTGVTVTNGGSGYTAPVTVGISGGGGLPLEITRSITDSSIGPGINYSLSVPMDSGNFGQNDDITAMQPLLPFTIRVVIRGVNYVPMQIKATETPTSMEFWRAKIDGVNDPGISDQGKHWAIGKPAGNLRLDLWLGVDSNNDGLPDEWQRSVVNSDESGQLTDFTQIDPNALGRNGLTYYQNYIFGTYPLEPSGGIRFNIDSITNGIGKLHFQAVTGRTYSISSSVDLENWTHPEPFSLQSDGSNPASHHLADAAKIQDIYVPLAGAVTKYFKLHVE